MEGVRRRYGTTALSSHKTVSNQFLLISQGNVSNRYAWGLIRLLSENPLPVSL